MFGNHAPRATMRYIVNFNTVDYEPHERIPELWENETLDFQLSKVEFSFSNDPQKCQGVGKLYVTSKRVLWVGTEKAFDFDVPYITLHAVSKDPSTYPKPCVYCQVDVEEDEIMDEDEEDSENALVTEFYLVPEDEQDLQNVFDALSHAALINPDPDEDGEGEDDFIFNQEEVVLGAEQARILDHLDSVFQFPSEGTDGVNNQTKSEESSDNTPMDS